MDPVLEFLHRHQPADHSLDGLPVTWILGALLFMHLVGLVLAATGRSWKKWLAPAALAWAIWWFGVMF